MKSNLLFNQFILTLAKDYTETYGQVDLRKKGLPNRYTNHIEEY